MKTSSTTLIATWRQKFGAPEDVEHQAINVHDAGNPEVTGD
jgi:hypothetical protein